MTEQRLLRLAVLGAASAAVVATAGITAGIASANTSGPSGRAVLANTGAGSLAAHTHLARINAASTIRVSVMIGRNQAGLAAFDTAVSTPGSALYRHFLSAAQVRARYGATAASSRAVAGWLHAAGLRVTYRGPFTVTALGRASNAERALGTTIDTVTGSTAVHVIPAGNVSVPAALASSINTVNLSPRVVPGTPHENLPKLGSGHDSPQLTEKCSTYYGQKKAKGTPKAYGKTQTWAPCGYTPQQMRAAYSAPSTDTGTGVTLGILSEDTDSTALSDANTYFKSVKFQKFKKGQFQYASGGPAPYNNEELVEDAMDIESSHSMAPDADVIYSTADGTVTGSPLLDAYNQLVSADDVQTVTSSWYEGYMSGISTALIDAWESVLQQGTAEGISVNFATGDYGTENGLQYPGSDPMITCVGGTSIAIGAKDKTLWTSSWEADASQIVGDSWSPAPPGEFEWGGTGGISTYFKEPAWQKGVVPASIDKTKMRAVPDVSAMGDPAVGGFTYGLTQDGVYTTTVDGGTSLSSPLFTGMEADAIQASGGAGLGFMNPTFYELGAKALADVTGPSGKNPQAVVFGTDFGLNPPWLMSANQCQSTGLTCNKGYDTSTGVGTPGKSFYTAFGQ